MTLALTDFSQETIEKVVTRVLALDRVHHNNSFSIGTLQTTLPTTEETQFRQPLNARCAPSLATRLSTALYGHTVPSVIRVELCEYNMLNRTNKTVEYTKLNYDQNAHNIMSNHHHEIDMLLGPGG